jgi:hypothetical protein
MYKGSSTSFGYVEKVEDQVPRCGVCGEEAEGSRARQRVAAEVLGVERCGGGGGQRRSGGRGDIVDI